MLLDKYLKTEIGAAVWAERHDARGDVCGSSELAERRGLVSGVNVGEATISGTMSMIGEAPMLGPRSEHRRKNAGEFGQVRYESGCFISSYLARQKGKEGARVRRSTVVFKVG
ncbi:unnamed protein product [Linum trigynum]|uniref:Uncharacterized protein n=1 Tax=Linum trigynum TaxID=586398 RepID=A0AAV2E0W2_9ROSI